MTRRRSFRGWIVNPRVRTLLLDTFLALGVVAVFSVVIWLVDRTDRVSNISNLYIMGTAVLAARRGVYPAIVASVVAFLTYVWISS